MSPWTLSVILLWNLDNSSLTQHNFGLGVKLAGAYRAMDGGNPTLEFTFYHGGYIFFAVFPIRILSFFRLDEEGKIVRWDNSFWESFAKLGPLKTVFLSQLI